MTALTVAKGTQRNEADEKAVKMMSDSREQSLDENVVFFPVTEARPDFLHSEAERYALEHLLSAGPGAFYTRLGAEQLGPFLCPEEVNQVSGWAEDYRSADVRLENGEAEDEGSSETQKFSMQYFPTFSDTPAPSLELGWPEKENCMAAEHVEVFTNPPLERAPHVREVVRRVLQGANMLIAIVMDRVTDSAVIGDLHKAASRGVAVYIILNRRSVQENFTINLLRHPTGMLVMTEAAREANADRLHHIHKHIRVRTLGGKTFLSRDGRMVVGELKENFVLVDLETVILGNYSLTWTDAHLHRQLITVIRGPAVESFDREFRILYAASLPIPDTVKASRPVGILNADGIHNLCQPEHLELKSTTPVLLDSTWNPPSPHSDTPVDWDALGVFAKSRDFTEDPILSPELCEEPPYFPGQAGDSGGAGVQPTEKGICTNKDLPRLQSKEHEETRHELEYQPEIRLFPSSIKPDHLSIGIDRKETRSERNWKSDGLLNKCESPVKSTVPDQRENTYRPGDNTSDMTQKDDSVPLLFSHRRESALSNHGRFRGTIIPEETTSHQAPTDETSVKRPVILRVPQMESFSSLSDILRRINSRQSTKSPLRREAKTTISKSMLDLNLQEADTPQNGMTGNYDSVPITPALALMKKRHEEIKSGFMRTPRTILPQLRPRSSSFVLQRETWRSPFFREQRDDTEDK